MDNYIIIPLLCLLLCQLLKLIIESIKNKKLSFKRFIGGSGGIPSSHTTLITSITTLIGLESNFKGPIFGLSLIALYIICYDAMHVRNEVEKHSKILNKLTNSNLKEEIGHNFIEVLAGLVFGITITIILYYLF